MSSKASRAQLYPKGAARLPKQSARPPSGSSVLSTDVCRVDGPGCRPRLAAQPRFAEEVGAYQPGEVLHRSVILGAHPSRAAPAAPPAEWAALDAEQKYPWLSPRRPKGAHREESEPEGAEISCDCSTADTETGALTSRGLASELRVTRQSSPGAASSQRGAASSKPSPRGQDKPVYLDLSRALAGAELGSAEMPTLGSIGHFLQKCKPCAFVYKGGCTSGVECQFCHLCQPGEKKKRKKENKAVRKASRCVMLY